MATSPPMMATVLSALKAELRIPVSEGAAICGGGVVVDTLFLGLTAAEKKFIESDRLMHTIKWEKNHAIK